MNIFQNLTRKLTETTGILFMHIDLEQQQVINTVKTKLHSRLYFDILLFYSKIVPIGLRGEYSHMFSVAIFVAFHIFVLLIIF